MNLLLVLPLLVPLATAAATGNRALAAKALAENPLVDPAAAPKLFDAILAAHGASLAYLK